MKNLIKISVGKAKVLVEIARLVLCATHGVIPSPKQLEGVRRLKLDEDQAKRALGYFVSKGFIVLVDGEQRLHSELCDRPKSARLLRHSAKIIDGATKAVSRRDLVRGLTAREHQNVEPLIDLGIRNGYLRVNSDETISLGNRYFWHIQYLSRLSGKQWDVQDNGQPRNARRIRKAGPAAE